MPMKPLHTDWGRRELLETGMPFFQGNTKRKWRRRNEQAGFPPRCQKSISCWNRLSRDLRKATRRQEIRGNKLKEVKLRKLSMEKLGETLTRKGEDGGATPRKRASASETIVYLREKAERDFDLRKEELETRKRDQTQQLQMCSCNSCNNNNKKKSSNISSSSYKINY